MALPDARGVLALLFPSTTARPAARVPKVTISVPHMATVVTLSITDAAVDLGDLSDDWATTRRPDRKPVLQRSGQRLRTRKLTATLDDEIGVGGARDTETAIKVLEGMAHNFDTVTVAYSSLEAGQWSITGLTAKVTRRGPGHNRATRAELTITLTEPSAPALPPALRPVVVSSAAMKPGTSVIVPPPAAGAAPARRYTVKAGDTLWGIAVKVYGDGTRWTAIAQANAIRDPRRLAVGQVLVLP